MGWRGALRTMAAASRAATRENNRRAKLHAKQQMVTQAAGAVEEWQKRVDRLTTIQVLIPSSKDWQRTAALPKPTKPFLKSVHVDNARRQITRFRPRFWDFLQGGSEKKRQKFEQALANAPSADQKELENAMLVYEKSIATWLEDTTLAARVLAGKAEAFKEVVQAATDAFNEGQFGKSIEFQYGDNFLHVIPTLFDTDIVPKSRCMQLVSGRLSETDMPAVQFYKYYQDYVAGTAFGVADAILKLLPISEVYVTCKTEMLNAATGYKELTPILSVQVVRETFGRLNLENIDASEALRNFNHSMSFKKTSSFSGIRPLA